MSYFHYVPVLLGLPYCGVIEYFNFQYMAYAATQADIGVTGQSPFRVINALGHSVAIWQRLKN